MTHLLGWIASAAFLSSYLFRDPVMLRRIQSGAALIWASYGVVLESPPIIVTNLLVAVLALWSAWRAKKEA